MYTAQSSLFVIYLTQDCEENKLIYTTIFQTYTTEIENYIEAELSQVKSLDKKLLFTQQQEQQRSNLFNLQLIRLNNPLQYFLNSCIEQLKNLPTTVSQSDSKSSKTTSTFPDFMKLKTFRLYFFYKNDEYHVKCICKM